MNAAPDIVLTEAAIIETAGVWRIFRLGKRDVPALRGINLKVQPNRFIALKGRSGSGKTTLLNCLSGLDKATAGTVHVLNRDITHLDEDSLTLWRRHEVGIIFQSFGLLPTLSAYENVELMQRLINAPAQKRKEATQRCLELVGITRWAKHRPYEMSGGQQQRVAIARALVNSPRLILADEPTGELDSTTAQDILKLFRKIVDEEHITLVMSSHDPLVDGFVDEIVQLRDGRIVAR
jgi:putative ABC transport system ATP-binding protein